MPVPAGLLVGTFDLFHVGHLDALLRATRLADRVVVAVVADDTAARLTGQRPFVPETERRAIVGAVRGVAEVVLVEDALGPVLDRTGAALVLTMDDDPAAELLVAGLGVPVAALPEGRRTTSAALRAALEPDTGRSSVA